MDDSNFKIICDNYGSIVVDSELLSCAFAMTVTFPSWEDWFSHLKNTQAEEVFGKLKEASSSILEGMPPDIDGFRVGAITMERSAVDSLKGQLFVPMDFVSFVRTSCEKN